MDLFSSYRLGSIELKNRIVMAPMTRSRALGGVPNDLMSTYYAQRASAGLIITEGVAPSPNALGYARIPGIYSAEQIEGWRSVVDGVHRAAGRIFVQLMHVGRIAHPLNMPPNGRILAPSAVRVEQSIWTDQAGAQPVAMPEEMTPSDLRQTRAEFVSAARNALEAGFDGVELHAANGYLLEQFLHPHTNRRTDEYGSDLERRARFLIEISQACADAVGATRVGVRLSPHSTFNDMPAHPEVEAQYSAVAAGLRGLLYVHLVNQPTPEFQSTARAIRAAYHGPIIVNGGFDLSRARAELRTGSADLVAFGRPFIANPDFVHRLQSGLALAEPEPSTFYTPGAQGYVDYPTLAG